MDSALSLKTENHRNRHTLGTNPIRTKARVHKTHQHAIKHSKAHSKGVPHVSVRNENSRKTGFYRNRFEGCRIHSLDLNSLISLNFVVIESIRSSSEPIRFWAGTQASNLNRFVRGSNRLKRGIQKMEYLLRVLSRFGHKANRFVFEQRNRLEVRAEPIQFWAVAKTKFLNRFAILASRLKLLDFEDFKNLYPRRVESVRRGIDSKPFYTFLTELELQVESIRESLESIRAFLNLENEEFDRRYKVIHFLG
ncbi:hypothetical protein PIB30_074632 [Stylosanthes scabra]|uniref:Uncharacterized protein n=1 Tax=Stylosanthes scabra TaxID=79078 RepID=A0ABU6TPG6_9FABA|nr:hypothetical protein [Stylosanthes scabra]